jgi:tetratricopeptide (TPR) repeat protein
VRWLGRAGATEEALRRRLAGAVPPAVSSQVVLARGQLRALASRTGVPAWGLVALVAVLVLAGVFVARGGLVGTRDATPTAAAPVPTQVPDADLFARCDDAVAEERWADAIRDCRVARARTPDREGLAPKLAAAYVGRGEQRRGAGDLTAAEGDFEQALAFHPESSEAQRALQQLTLYQEGDKALVTGAWDVAVAQLSLVHAEAPDYLQNLGERSLEGKLFAAWLKWGQSALNADDKPTAAARCAQALALVPDDAEAQTCLDAATAPSSN